MANEEYYKKNKNLTNSKLSDFLKDPYYFYQRHITGELRSPYSDAFLVGKAVDIWLTESEAKFREQYVAVTRRNLKNPPTDYTELPMSQFDLIVKICKKVEQQQVYKDIIKLGYISQEILKVERDNLGIYFDALAGIPDWYRINDDNIGIIVDLKTSATINPRQYIYHCEDYGYYRQQAMYQMLLAIKYPNVKSFVSRHLVVEKDTTGIHRVAFFAIDQKKIDVEKLELESLFEKIKSIKEYKPQNLQWEDAIEI